MAIGAFKDVLSVWTRENNPEGWAAVRMKLGAAYLERPTGNRAENLEGARSAFEDALSVWTREANPEEWAATHMKLGIAYRERLAGNRSENRERAIACFANALSAWTRERNPEELAAARAHLETAGRERFGEWLANRAASGSPEAQRQPTGSLLGWVRRSAPVGRWR
jgi:hypothetical protein